MKLPDSSRALFGILFIVAALVGTPIAIYSLQQQQELRQHAATYQTNTAIPTTSLYSTPTTPPYATQTPYPSPSAYATPYPSTYYPSSYPSPTICPTLGPVKNVRIDCPNCAKY